MTSSPCACSGRQVLGGAEHRAGRGDLGDAGAGDAEVGDPGAALAVDQHVLRLEVAVDDPARVGEPRAGEDLAGDLDRLVDTRPAVIRSLSDAPSTYSIAM